MNYVPVVLILALLSLANVVDGQERENESHATSAGHENVRATGNIALLHASLEERLKFGYGVDGWGPKGSTELYGKSEDELKAMAEEGNASAAHFLWTYYGGEGTDDLSTVRITESEELALDQFRRTGQTFLIYMTALRYQDVPGYQISTVAWYTLGGRLGDPVCAYKAKRMQNEYKTDPTLVDLQGRELMAKVTPTTKD